MKHIKARVDAKKGKMFSKLGHEIFIAARDGGGDIDLNPRLRQAVDAAKSQSMPKDNIERAIKKGTGELEGEAIEEITYEGFGPGGVGMLVQVATDNKNRSAAEIRNIFNKNNGNMGTSGSVAHLFQRSGEIRLKTDSIGDDDLLEAALDAGAEDVSRDDGDHVIVTAADQLNTVANHLRDESGLTLSSQELVYLPLTPIDVTENSIASQVIRLYEALDDYQDTLNVFANFEIPDDILEAISAN